MPDARIIRCGNNMGMSDKFPWNRVGSGGKDGFGGEISKGALKDDVGAREVRFQRVDCVVQIYDLRSMTTESFLAH